MSDDPLDIASYAAAPLTGGISLAIPAAKAVGGMMTPPGMEMPETPTPPSPTEMPDPDNLLNRQKKKRAAAATLTSGRASTILSDAASGMKLGG